MLWLVVVLNIWTLMARQQEATCHFVNSSGVPYPGPVRQYSTDKLDVRMLYEKGFCGCFCKLTDDQYWTWCRGKECQEVPRKVKVVNQRLRVTGTNITAIGPEDLADYSDLVDLDLDGNLLRNITDGAFAGLGQLVNLSMASNHLERLPAGVFRGLHSLRSLKLNKNKFITLDDVVPALVNLVHLRFITLSENTFGKIASDDFELLTNSSIESLELNTCDLRSVAGEAFLPLTNLSRLSLANNNMPDDNLANVFYVMRQSKLRQLDLSQLGFDGSPPYRLLETLSRTTLYQLILRQNTMSTLRKATFPSMPNILELDLSYCGIISIQVDTFVNLPKLERLNLAHNCMGSIPPAITTLPQLKWLDLTNLGGGGELEFNEGLFVNMTNLTFLDLSGNQLGQLSLNVFTGLGKLEELRLSNCSLYGVVDGCFQYLSSLRILQMDGNALTKQNFTRRMLHNMTRLEYLNMDRCKISFTDEQEAIFSGASNLRVLSLRRNEIQEFGRLNPFQDAFSLLNLDLSKNKIRSWNTSLFTSSKQLEVLDLSQNDIPTITSAMLQDFVNLSEVNLLGNPLDCDCSLRNLLPYASTSHQDTIVGDLIIRIDKCQSPSQWRFRPVVDFMKYMEKEDDCDSDPDSEQIITNNPSSWMVLLYVLIPILILAVVIAFIWYKTRWLIRLHFFRQGLSKTALTDRKLEAGQQSNYVYDAFVSYSNEDHVFVTRMVGMLENMPPHYKLCVYERDFTAGNVLNDMIVESIATSRKVVLIVSQHFVQSHWCLWELHLAQHSLLEEKRNGLVLVVMGKLKPTQLPPTLRFLMKTRIYLEWDPDPRKQQLFWQRLRGALAPGFTSSSSNSLVGISRESSSSQISDIGR